MVARYAATIGQEQISIEADELGRAGARAWVSPYGVSVWALVNHWQFNGGDIDDVADAYDLPVAAVKLAIAYYEDPANRAAIDHKLADVNSWANGR